MRRSGYATGTGYGLPPFTGAVRALIIANVAIHLLMAASAMTVPVLVQFASYFLYLRPVGVMHGQVWQLVSYSFFHDLGEIRHIVFNMLGLWMFGSWYEEYFGSSRFWQFYFSCVIGAALTTMAVGAFGVYAYGHMQFPIFAIMGWNWRVATLGASGGIYGLIVAYGMIMRDSPVYVFGVFPLKARYFAIIWVAMSLVSAFLGSNGVAEFAHLGGALFGYLYIKFVPRYGLQTAASESAFGLRNAYYRWKRRQAAKKFEVYMRNTKRTEYFDEKGKYRGPNLDKDDDHWVN